MEEIRKIKEGERVAYVRLARYAFHDWSDDVVDEGRLSWAEPRDVIGYFVDGALAAALINFAAEQSVRGVVKPMAGISCVTTAPDYRDRGYVRALMHAALGDMRDRGLAVSMLRPFRESFYAKFGYVTANSSLTVGFPPAALARQLAYVPPAGWGLETRPAKDVLPRIKAFWQKEVLPRHHGLIFLHEASRAEWEMWAKDTLATFALREGEPRGLARYRKSGYGDEGKVQVPELFWLDDDARDLLLQFLARHRDQVGEIKLALPYGFNFQQWLEDVPRRLDIGIMHLPWMVRVVDAAAALDGLPAATPGEVKLEVVDEQCDWNAGVYLLAGDGGRLRAERVGGEAPVRLDARALSALAYGTLGPEELSRRGWLSRADAATRELLGRWFPPRPLFNTVDF
jgi:predicted acetyltransferase